MEDIKLKRFLRQAAEDRLTSLNLCANNLVSLPKEIGQLTSLRELYLYGNHLHELPKEIEQLTKLRELHLHQNSLTELPKQIGELQNLEVLNLSGNKLKTLPKEIGQLVNLRELFLSENKLTDLTGIERLTNLSRLDLSGNTMIELPKEIMQLINLKELSLFMSHLIVLTGIGRLANLSRLDLSGNTLTKIPEEIGYLTNLSVLDLSRNQIVELPKEICELTNLKELFLYNNHITKLPKEINGLTNLIVLNLNKNKLVELPKEIGQLINLKRFNLEDNPIQIPPPEIVEEGTGAIKNYLRQLGSEGKDSLYEAKLIIVGEAGAGKTTFAKKIENPNYILRKNEKSTEGIDVIQLKFLMGDGQPFRINIWDFGGQEIYHATHQFFLTKRSLYALVADTRREDTDFFYWLNVVELLSDKSPVLIIKNEKQDRQREINENQLRSQFNNLKAIMSTNLATNRGLSEIANEIKHYITSLEHVGTTLPKTWVKVRKRLENDKRYYIGIDEYLEICEKNGFTEIKDKLQLSSFLHDLGVCLHFQEDPLLKKTVILRPEWGTEAVYKLLDDKFVINNLGKFRKRDLEKIWHDEKYSKMRDELLQLMINFKLCYKIPQSLDSYIAPQLLTENQPDYDWDENDNLFLRYTYEFLPKGIITRFIVVMHAHIMDQRFVWRSGVILQKEKTKAEIIEYYGKREIRIRVSGISKKELMTIITYEIDKIHASYKRLKYNKLIPCNCSICKKSISPHFYLSKHLNRRIQNKEYEVQCEESYEKVSVLDLIDDVVLPKEQDRLELGNNAFLTNPPFLVQQIVHQEAKVEAKVDFNTSIHLPSIQFDFEELKNHLVELNPAFEKRLAEIGDKLDEVSSEDDSSKLKNPLNKLGRFLIKLGQEDSDYNKLIKGSKKAISLVKKISKTYNKIAQILALPQVPDLFLK